MQFSLVNNVLSEEIRGMTGYFLRIFWDISVLMLIKVSRGGISKCELLNINSTNNIL
jgi:hypothetical protein